MTDHTSAPPICLDISDGIGIITLHRPPVNILDIKTMELLIQAFREAAVTSDIRVLLLRAEGPCFCAGMDVEDHTPERAPLMMERFQELFLALRQISVPVVAAVQGAALGGGFELVMACDMIVASEKAKFGQPEIKLGFFPPLAAFVLPQRLFPSVAHEINLLGESISVQRAYELGLVNRVFPVDKFHDLALDFTQRISTHSGAVIRLYKKAYHQSQGQSFDQALATVKQIFVEELMLTDDVLEGLRSFRDKTQAQWKHR